MEETHSPYVDEWRRRQGLPKLDRELHITPFETEGLSAKQIAWLKALQRSGSMTIADCEALISSKTRSNWHGQNPRFREFATLFLQEYRARIGHHIKQRAEDIAYEGWREEVYDKGEFIGFKTRRESSTTRMVLESYLPDEFGVQVDTESVDSDPAAAAGRAIAAMAVGMGTTLEDISRAAMSGVGLSEDLPGAEAEEPGPEGDPVG